MFPPITIQSLVVIQHASGDWGTKSEDAIAKITASLDKAGIPWIYLPPGLIAHGIPINDATQLQKLLNVIGPGIEEGIKRVIDHGNASR